MSEMIHEEYGRQRLDDQHFEPPYTGVYELELTPTPTWRKRCEKCEHFIERWRGDTHVGCGVCGAQYNASGQRLRDDWAGNRSNFDDEVSDMDGYEDQHAGDE